MTDVDLISALKFSAGIALNNDKGPLAIILRDAADRLEQLTAAQVAPEGSVQVQIAVGADSAGGTWVHEIDNYTGREQALMSITENCKHLIALGIAVAFIPMFTVKAQTESVEP